MSNYVLDRDNHQELHELLEDMVEYWCDKHCMSGELAWTVVECMALAKQEELKGRL